MNYKGIFVTCAVASLTLGSIACRPLAMTADRMVFGGNTAKKEAELEALRTERDELAAEYDRAAVTLKKDIEEDKKEIDALIEQAQIGPALVAIKQMNEDLHKTDYSETKRHRLTAKLGLEQKDYLRDASARTLAAVDRAMTSGKFQQLDSWLVEREDLPADEATQQGFAAKHAELYGMWLKFLESEVERTRTSSPGSALVYALKAKSLAEKLEDGAAVQRMGSVVKVMRAQIVEDHAYVFTVTSAPDANAKEVASALKSSSWGSRKIVASSSKSARTDATVSISLGTPSYKASKSSTSDSFKYQSGTQQVPNPELDRAQSDIDSIQRDIERLEDQRSDEQKRFEDNSDMARCEAGGRVQSCANARESATSNIRNIEGKLSDEREDLADAQSKLASLPKTITAPVYDQYDYPVTVHHMKASYSFEARVSSLRGVDGALRSTTLDTHLTDEEHAAHSINDGSVSADPADPPSQRDALESLQTKAKSTLEAVIVEGFTAHREAMLAGLPDQEEARIHALAVYVLMDPETASEAAVSQLEELSQVKGITALMK